MDAFAHYKKIEVDEDALPEVDEDEVAKHNTPEDLWVIVYGRVYDVTEWQHSHPGGDFILQEYGGKDASEMFRSVQHSPDANGIRPNFMIARLKKKTKATAVIARKAETSSTSSKLQKRAPPPKPPSVSAKDSPAASAAVSPATAKRPAAATPARTPPVRPAPVKPQTKSYAVVDTVAAAPLKRKVGPAATIGSNKSKL